MLSVRLILGFPPPHLVQPHRVLEPAQHHVAPVREQEALTCHEVTHYFGDENLTRLCLGTYPGSQLDGGAEQVFVLRHRLSCIQADAHLERRLSLLCNALLDGDGAF